MTPSRRRTLRILAAGLAVPLGILGLQSTQGLPRPVRWHGEALGAVSSMTLWSVDPARASRALRRMHSEIARMEAIFSLFRPASELSRLNREGRIERPSRDLVEVLDLSRRIADASRGAFDPTIQPLWALHAGSGAPDPGLVARVLPLVDYTCLTARRNAIQFGRPNMAASLNGIAQGYITDRITELLGNEGFESAVIELGETRVLGQAPDGQPVSIGLVNPNAPARISSQVALADAAISVSGGYGQVLPDGTGNHIFDPRSGLSAGSLSQVAVVAPKSALADALSTAICVAGEEAAQAILSTVPASRAILTRPDGTSVEV